MKIKTTYTLVMENDFCTTIVASTENEKLALKMLDAYADYEAFNQYTKIAERNDMCRYIDLANETRIKIVPTQVYNSRNIKQWSFLQ